MVDENAEAGTTDVTINVVDKPCCGENVFATGQEIAKMFRVSNSTVNLWKRQGMPFYGKSSCARFKIDEIVAWQKGQSELPVTKGKRGANKE